MARRTAVLLFFALVSGLVAFGQAGQQSSPQTNRVVAAAPVMANPVIPKNLKDLMVLGWRVNGVEGVDKPWHLKATYQTFDADGNVTGSGTYEEWVASPEKWK